MLPVTKQWLAFLLAAVLILSMVACGGDKPTITDTPESTTTALEPSVPDGPWEKYPEPIVIERGQSTATVTIFDEGEDHENNIWTKEAKERFNLDIQDYWAVDGSQYNEKMNISIASQDIPDVMSVSSTQLAQMIKAGMLQDMEEVFEKNASPLLKEIMAADTLGFDSGRGEDGMLYGLSQQHYGVIGALQNVWIRDDWMKNLGIEAPKTLEDIYSIAERFATEDPDGNGIDDTYGLAEDKTLGVLSELFAAYNAYPSLWLKDEDGKVVYGGVQPEIKEGLAAMQDLYSRGILNKEFAVMDGPKKNEDMISNKVGMTICPSWLGYNPGVDVIKHNGPEAIYNAYLLPGRDGGNAKMGSGWNVIGYVVVNKDYKHPEAVVRMLNLYAYMANESTKDEFQKFIEEREMKQAASPFIVANPNADLNQQPQIAKALETGDESILTPPEYGKYFYVKDWIETKNPDAVGHYMQVGPEGSSYSVLTPLVNANEYVMTEFRGISPQSMIEKSGSLKAMQNEVYTKIIMGESLDSFDEFVENWYSLGGQDITDDMNALQ